MTTEYSYCQEYCPNMFWTGMKSTPETREAAVGIAGTILDIENCPGVGYSQETPQGHLCNSPEAKRFIGESIADIAVATAQEQASE